MENLLDTTDALTPLRRPCTCSPIRNPCLACLCWASTHDHDGMSSSRIGYLATITTLEARLAQHEAHLALARKNKQRGRIRQLAQNILRAKRHLAAALGAVEG